MSRLLRRFYLPSLISILSFCLSLSTAQSGEELNQMDFPNLRVLSSNNSLQRAADLGKRTNEAIELFSASLGFSPEVRLLVLEKDDWSSYTKMPVYGMPHYQDSNLIVAAEENAFWSGFLPPLQHLPEEKRELIRTTYSSPPGEISMKKFFDLIAVHELAHGFHYQAGVNMQRKWLQEFFANLVMYTYTAEAEPDLLPVIEVFSAMVVQPGSDDFKYTSLQDFETHYHTIANQAPKNYGWYQCRFNLVAKQVYQTGGLEQLQSLWNSLKEHPEELSDSELNVLLEESLGEKNARSLTAW